MFSWTGERKSKNRSKDILYGYLRSVHFTPCIPANGEDTNDITEAYLRIARCEIRAESLFFHKQRLNHPFSCCFKFPNSHAKEEVLQVVAKTENIHNNAQVSASNGKFGFAKTKKTSAQRQFLNCFFLYKETTPKNTVRDEICTFFTLSVGPCLLQFSKDSLPLPCSSTVVSFAVPCVAGNYSLVSERRAGKSYVRTQMRVRFLRVFPCRNMLSHSTLAEIGTPCFPCNYISMFQISGCQHVYALPPPPFLCPPLLRYRNLRKKFATPPKTSSLSSLRPPKDGTSYFSVCCIETEKTHFPSSLSSSLALPLSVLSGYPPLQTLLDPTHPPHPPHPPHPTHPTSCRYEFYDFLHDRLSRCTFPNLSLPGIASALAQTLGACETLYTQIKPLYNSDACTLSAPLSSPLFSTENRIPDTIPFLFYAPIPQALVLLVNPYRTCKQHV